jgi:hypothetical protein
VSSQPDLPLVWLTDPRLATALAYAAHSKATCWCWEHNSDGVFPKASLRFLGRAGQQRTVDQLVKSQLWLDTGTDYVLTDYLEHQKSKYERDQARAQWRENNQKRRHGK